MPRPSETIDSGVSESMKNFASLRAYSYQAKALKIKELANKSQTINDKHLHQRIFSISLDMIWPLRWMEITLQLFGTREPIKWLLLYTYFKNCMLNDRHAQPLADPKLHENERNWTGGACLAPLLSSISFIFIQKSCQIIVFSPEVRIWRPLSRKFWICQIVSEVGSPSGLEGGNFWWSRLNVRNANWTEINNCFNKVLFFADIKRIPVIWQIECRTGWPQDEIRWPWTSVPVLTVSLFSLTRKIH